ncbi:putative exported serine protease inhibitor [Bradyrhizobiaceae bacterium SG-6C]|nr:putative exported serine protease inhibitor [Bradyrhizobiaceae bacterium SG-6C]
MSDRLLRWRCSVRMLSTAIAGCFAIILSNASAADLRIPIRGEARQAVQSDFSSKLLRAQLGLSGRLIRILAKEIGPGENIVVSPASLAATFSMLDVGSNSEMGAAIRGLLGFEGKQTGQKSDLVRLRTTLAEGLSKSNKSPLTISNLIVFAPWSNPRPASLARLSAAGADVAVRDLTGRDGIEFVNSFVSERSKGLIPKILEEPPNEAGIVAINALHFKDDWQRAFDLSRTETRPFFKLEGSSQDVSLMSLEGSFAFRQNQRFVAAELPYATDRYKLVVITTRDGPAEAVEFLENLAWLDGRGFEAALGEIFLPRLSLSESSDLLQAIDSLGLRIARQKRDSFKYFSAYPQKISQIVQKVNLDINESGTEAAAATAVSTTREASLGSSYLKLVIDKPFLFALRDVKSGLIHMAGYVGQPGRSH